MVDDIFRNSQNVISIVYFSNEEALVAHLSKHKGPVRGLEFNSITPNLLASGADDGEILTWDLTSPAEPSHFPPLKGSGTASQGEMSFVSRNCKVQNILASASYNGTTELGLASSTKGTEDEVDGNLSRP
ncbi:hypothetical protein ACFE04_019458 [Oxalis oulophora]